MKTDWKIEKDSAAPPKGRWILKYRPEGHAWGTMGRYSTRRAALTVAFLMRERGERVSWHGGPIRMGLALVESC
jgi:hypothetical protein